MIRFRFGALVPPGAANLAYIPVPPATAQTHLTLADFSVDIPENVADNFGSDVNVIVDPTGVPVVATPETVDTSKLLVSPRSIVSRNVTKPVKLFYKHALSLLIYDTEADDTDLALAKETIRPRITILDGEKNATNDLLWDISVDSLGAPGDSYSVTLYTDRVGSRGQTFLVKYDGIDTGGARFPNHIEVLNPTPILTEGSDYTVLDTSSSTGAYNIDGLANGNLAPAIALFYNKTDGGSGTATVTADDLILWDGAKGATIGLKVGGDFRPVRDVVADINAANVELVATCLTDSKRAQMVQRTDSIPRTGVVLRHDRIAHVRYTDQLRIRPLPPRAGSALTPWYPRVMNGTFTQKLSGGTTLRYAVNDYNYQVFHTTYGAPYKSVVDEEPRALSSRRWRVARWPLRGRADLRLFLDGVEDTTLLDDVDLHNGILFLNRTVDPNARLSVSYVYEDTGFTYTGINLNPTLRQNPVVLGKYVGVYILPRNIITGSAPAFTVAQRERTVFHVMRNNAQEIIDLIPTLTQVGGAPAYAKLLGIYRTTQTEDTDDVDIVDTRVAGGGLRYDLLPSDVDEAEAAFYADVGGHFDGEPFPDASTLIVEIPETLPLDNTGELVRLDLYESMGSDYIIDPSGWIDPSGVLTRDEIHNKVRRHVDAAAFVLEDYYTT